MRLGLNLQGSDLPVVVRSIRHGRYFIQRGVLHPAGKAIAFLIPLNRGRPVHFHLGLDGARFR